MSNEITGLNDPRIVQLIEEARNGDADKFKELIDYFNLRLLEHIGVRIKASIHDLTKEEIDGETAKIAAEIWKKETENIKTPPEAGGFNPLKMTYYGYICKKYSHMFWYCNKELYGLIQQFREACKMKNTVDSDTYWQLIFEKLKNPLSDAIKNTLKIMDKSVHLNIDSTIKDIRTALQKAPHNKGFGHNRRDIITWLMTELHLIEKDFKKEILAPPVNPEEEYKHPEPLDPVNVEDDVLKLVSFEVLLKLICHCGGYPHEQFTFFYSTFLYGSTVYSNLGEGGRRQRTVQGDPQTLVKLHSESSLQSLHNNFARVLTDIPLYQGILDIQEIMDPVAQRLDYLVKDLITTRAVISILATQIVGATCILDYVTDYPEKKEQLSEAEKAEYQKILRDDRVRSWNNELKNKILKVLDIPKNALFNEAVDSMLKEGSDIHYGFSRHCKECDKLKDKYPCVEQRKK